jgi:hypothetical protein
MEADVGNCFFPNYLRKLGAFFEPSIPQSPFLRSAMLLLAEVLTERDQWQGKYLRVEAREGGPNSTVSQPEMFGVYILISASCVIGRMETEPETFEHLRSGINSVLSQNLCGQLGQTNDAFHGDSMARLYKLSGRNFWFLHEHSRIRFLLQL